MVSGVPTGRERSLPDTGVETPGYYQASLRDAFTSNPKEIFVHGPQMILLRAPRTIHLHGPPAIFRSPPAISLKRPGDPLA